MAKKSEEKIIVTTEAIREVENTDALRLQNALAKKQCRHCGQRVWIVVRTDGDIRYLKCKGCLRTDKIVVKRDAAALPEAQDAGSEEDAPDGEA